MSIFKRQEAFRTDIRYFGRLSYISFPQRRCKFTVCASHLIFNEQLRCEDVVPRKYPCWHLRNALLNPNEPLGFYWAINQTPESDDQLLSEGSKGNKSCGAEGPLCNKQKYTAQKGLVEWNHTAHFWNAGRQKSPSKVSKRETVKKHN